MKVIVFLVVVFLSSSVSAKEVFGIKKYQNISDFSYTVVESNAVYTEIKFESVPRPDERIVNYFAYVSWNGKICAVHGKTKISGGTFGHTIENFGKLISEVYGSPKSKNKKKYYWEKSHITQQYFGDISHINLTIKDRTGKEGTIGSHSFQIQYVFDDWGKCIGGALKKQKKIKNNF